MAEFLMPSLGADMEFGTMVEWRVKPGDRFKRGDIVAEVETGKGVIDIEIFQEGIIDLLVVQPGQRVPVGAPLAIVRTEHELVVAPAGPAVQQVEGSPSLVVERTDASVTAAPRAAVSPTRHLRVSPLARRLAEQLGINLETVEGAGPHGAIERCDVERAAATHAAAQPPAPPAPTAAADKSRAVPAVSEIRLAIAAAMARSNREIPHYYLQTHVDMSKSLEWLARENQKRSIAERILPGALLVRAVSRALGDVPELNGFWRNDRPEPQESVHIGFAIALRTGGLITPAIRHADLKSIDELMEAIRDLITRTRSGHLRSSELSDTTITLTSLGELGVETVYGVIYPPQLALVGFGKISERPWAENGMLGVRPIIAATLAADHRATDGDRGARFLEMVGRYLQEPE
jgi:pyruvate dehydrogenase E2 component (dihydrolipoamide acetyltransferase)